MNLQQVKEILQEIPMITLREEERTIDVHSTYISYATKNSVILLLISDKAMLSVYNKDATFQVSVNVKFIETFNYNIIKKEIRVGLKHGGFFNLE